MFPLRPIFQRIALAVAVWVSLAPLGRVEGGEVTMPGSFAYVLQADSLAKAKAAAIQQLAASERDWVVLDAAYATGAPWTRADLDAIRKGKSGRKVICYLSIGEAEDYRPYWRKEWTQGAKPTAAAPSWLVAVNPDWAGNFKVKYWQADWQKIMLPAVRAVMEAGFDGLYLDIIDGFEFFEQEGKNYVDDKVNAETKQTYRRDMVDWVKAIAAEARKVNPEAFVIPQNGAQLLAHEDYLGMVSGIGVEDLFTNGAKAQSKSHTREVLEALKPMAGTKKPVLVIEYPGTAEQREQIKKAASEKGFVWLTTDRELKTLGVSGK